MSLRIIPITVSNLMDKTYKIKKRSSKNQSKFKIGRLKWFRNIGGLKKIPSKEDIQNKKTLSLWLTFPFLAHLRVLLITLSLNICLPNSSIFTDSYKIYSGVKKIQRTLTYISLNHPHFHLVGQQYNAVTAS